MPSFMSVTGADAEAAARYLEVRTARPLTRARPPALSPPEPA